MKKNGIIWPEHEISIRFASVPMRLINAYADVSLNFGMGFHQHPYFVYAITELSGESGHMRKLARGSVAS